MPCKLSNRENLRDVIVAKETNRAKCFHLGLGHKPIAKTTLATANQNRDYRIFEDFAFYMMSQTREKRAENIFKLGGKVYAFDSTMTPLCQSVFWRVKFRKKKGAVKAHVLYDLEAQVPVFYTSPQLLSMTSKSCEKFLIRLMSTTSSTEIIHGQDTCSENCSIRLIPMMSKSNMIPLFRGD